MLKGYLFRQLTKQIHQSVILCRGPNAIMQVELTPWMGPDECIIHASYMTVPSCGPTTVQAQALPPGSLPEGAGKSQQMTPESDLAAGVPEPGLEL